MARDIINRHRGLREGELPRRYLRRNERPHADSIDDGPAHGDEDHDVYWDYEEQVAFTAADFVLHRLSTEIMWSVPPARPDDVDAPALAPPGVSADALPDALHEHVARFDTPAAVRAYLAGAAGPALDDLARARASRPELARWFAERPGPAFMLVLFAPFWIRPLRAWAAPAGSDVDAIGRSLVEHLLVRYEVPAALWEPWRSITWPHLKWVLWLVVLGQGASLRSAAVRFGWDVAGKAIFSVCFEGQRRVTVELEPRTRCVVQVRGNRNRSATDEELAAIHRWLAATTPSAT